MNPIINKKVDWNDDIKQRRDTMFEVSLDDYDDCIKELMVYDTEEEADLYFIAGKINPTTIRIYLELRRRGYIELEAYHVKKIFRRYFLSIDYVKEIRTYPIVFEYGVFQSKISRVPKYTDLVIMKLEQLARIKPYYPKMINSRINELKKNPEELIKVQNRVTEEDEASRGFFEVLIKAAKDSIESNK